MIWFSFIDTEESAISSPEPEIVVSDEPAVGLAESTEEEELPQPVDVQKCKKTFRKISLFHFYFFQVYLDA